jgi:hypothetical protein
MRRPYSRVKYHYADLAVSTATACRRHVERARKFTASRAAGDVTCQCCLRALARQRDRQAAIRQHLIAEMPEIAALLEMATAEQLIKLNDALEGLDEHSGRT